MTGESQASYRPQYNAFGEELRRTGSASTRFGYQGTAWMRLDSGLYVSPTQLYVPGPGRFIQENPWPGVRLRYNASRWNTLGRWAAWSLRRVLARLVSRVGAIRPNLYDYLTGSPPNFVEPYSEGFSVEGERKRAQHEAEAGSQGMTQKEPSDLPYDPSNWGDCRAGCHGGPGPNRRRGGITPSDIWCFIRCMDPIPTNDTQAIFAFRNGINAYKGGRAALDVIEKGGSLLWKVGKGGVKGFFKVNPYVLVAESVCCILECATGKGLLEHIGDAIGTRKEAEERNRRKREEIEENPERFERLGRDPLGGEWYLDVGAVGEAGGWD